MNSVGFQLDNQGSDHATGCSSDHATGYTASSFLTHLSVMPMQLSSPCIGSASSCLPIPSGMTPSTSNTAFHSGKTSGQNMTRQPSFQYYPSISGRSPVQLGNQQRLRGDKTDISSPINHVTHCDSHVTQCDTYTASDVYSMLPFSESVHQGSMHQRSIHHGSVHQRSIHQGSMHHGSIYQGSIHQGKRSMHHGSNHHGVGPYDPYGLYSQWNFIRQMPLREPVDQQQQPSIRPSLDFVQQPNQTSMDTYHPHPQQSLHQLPSCQYQQPSCQFPSDLHLQPSFQPSGTSFLQLQSNHSIPPTSFSKNVGSEVVSSKCKGAPRLFSEQQTRQMANEYRREKYLTPTSRKKISEDVGLSELQVAEWFKRQRGKERKGKL